MVKKNQNKKKKQKGQRSQAQRRKIANVTMNQLSGAQRSRPQKLMLNTNLAVRSLAKSMADPWAYTACIPDGARYKSCFSVKLTGTLTTGSGGTCVSLVLNPSDPGALYYPDTLSTGSTFTLAGASVYQQAAAVATIQSLYGKVRPVSAGVRLTYVGTTTNDSGILVAGQFPGDVAISTLANGKNVDTVVAGLQNFIQCPVRNGVQITWSPDDYEAQGTFRPVTASAPTLAATTDAPGLFVGANILAASGLSSLHYDAIVNYEGQLDNQQIYVGQGSDSGPIVTGWFEKTMDLVRNNVPAKPIFEVLGNMASGYISSITSTNLSNLQRLGSGSSMWELD